jgi:hypothetical protein
MTAPLTYTVPGTAFGGRPPRGRQHPIHLSSTHPRVYTRCSPTSRSPSSAPRRTTMIRPPNDHGERRDHVSNVRAQHSVLERSAARSFWSCLP